MTALPGMERPPGRRIPRSSFRYTTLADGTRLLYAADGQYLGRVIPSGGVGWRTRGSNPHAFATLAAAARHFSTVDADLARMAAERNPA